MAKRKLERQETDFMREYIQEGINRNESVNQLKYRRKELAEFFDCTLSQVAGATAWKIQYDTRNNVQIVLLSIEHVFASKNMSDFGEASRSDEAETMNVEKGEVEDTKEESLSKETAIEIDTTSIKVHPKSGAWADYEHSVVKEKWREIEMNFIDKYSHLLNKKPEEWKVLCTPGIKCYLEVRHLLERGVKPENITAIEREKGAWEAFVENCEKLGIKPVYGELKYVLPELRTKFDIVLLDFLGQYCQSYQEVVYQVPLENTAIVSINIGGKREKKDVQRVMQKSLDGDLFHRLVEKVFLDKCSAEKLKRDGGSKQLDAQTASDRFFKLWGESHEEASKELESRDINISDDNRDAELLALMKSLGMGRADGWLYPNMVNNTPSIILPHDLDDIRKEKFNPDFIKVKNLFMALGLYERTMFPFRLAIKGKARKEDFYTRLQYEKLSDDLGPIVDLAWKASTGSVHVHSLEKYRYLSRVGQKPSPYLTNIAVVQRPVSDYKNQQRTTHFALRFAHVLAADHYNEIKNQYPIGLQDERIWVQVMDVKKRIKTITSIEIATALADIKKYHEVENRYPLNNLKNAKNIPRINIE